MVIVITYGQYHFDYCHTSFQYHYLHIIALPPMGHKIINIDDNIVLLMIGYAFFHCYGFITMLIDVIFAADTLDFHWCRRHYCCHYAAAHWFSPLYCWLSLRRLMHWCHWSLLCFHFHYAAITPQRYYAELLCFQYYFRFLHFAIITFAISLSLLIIYCLFCFISLRYCCRYYAAAMPHYCYAIIIIITICRCWLRRAYYYLRCRHYFLRHFIADAIISSLSPLRRFFIDISFSLAAIRHYAMLIIIYAPFSLITPFSPWAPFSRHAITLIISPLMLSLRHCWLFSDYALPLFSFMPCRQRLLFISFALSLRWLLLFSPFAMLRHYFRHWYWHWALRHMLTLFSHCRYAITG